MICHPPNSPLHKNEVYITIIGYKGSTFIEENKKVQYDLCIAKYSPAIRIVRLFIVKLTQY
ncbi:hypothetical protein [Metasolibacillus sp. FSL K6-0083]|uniref:hypothetical protein n=1 Tax=Metasolibacillus sp. FSL K6-0083 TaxID=2921416 RepID=UPI000B26B144